MGAFSSYRRRLFGRRALLSLAAAVIVTAGLLAVGLAAASPAAASATYWPLLRFGATGYANGQFGSSSPDGVAVDAAGNVYTCDPGNVRVEKFTSAGAFVCRIGDTDGLSFSYGVTVAPDGTVYVMDSYNDRVRAYTPNAGGTSYTSAGGWSIPSVSGLQAHGICTDTGSPCHIFVADGPNNEVLEYATTGTFLATIGSVGSGTSQFSNPQDVAATWSGTTGDLYVADAGNHRITAWHFNGATWAYAATVVSGVDVCQDPTGLDVDAGGNVYYTDFAHYRVFRYDLSLGSYSQAATYGTGSQVDRGNAGFWWGWGIAVSPSGATIYVGDTDNEVHKLGTDTAAPVTVAYAASATHNKTVKLRYKVGDPPQSCGSAFVTIKIYKGSVFKKRLTLGNHVTNVIQAYLWKCTLAKGSYTIRVYANDAAGHPQSKVGTAKLTVR